jgi:ribosomal protein S18 acetylase RimI-like enzyme
MTDVTIRRGTDADAPAIARVLLTARRAAMPWLAEPHTDEETYAWVADTVLRDDEVWVADEGSVVGFVAIGAATVEHLYVEPTRQRRGLGSELLSLAKEVRPGGFDLWVFQRNTVARRFYEGRGLELVEMTDGVANEEREPDARYRWTNDDVEPATSDEDAR